MTVEITDQMVEAYQRDGVVLVKGLWADWVDMLRAGVARNMANPTHQMATLKPGEPGYFFDDYCNWEKVPEFGAVIRQSQVAEVAGRAGPGDIPSNDWRPLALAAVLRAVIVDLLQITGLSRNQAREALADTWGRPFADRDEGRPDATGRGGGVERDDGPSPLWG